MVIRISPVVRSIVERKSARSFFKQPKPQLMFGLFNTKRNNDLLLLSEALAETRSQLFLIERKYEELEKAHSVLQEHFMDLEVPSQYEINEQIEEAIRNDAWDYIEPEAERMFETALLDYTNTEDLNELFENFTNTTESRNRAELARLTAFTFALIEELNLTHKVTELEERSSEIVETLLNTPDDEL